MAGEALVLLFLTCLTVTDLAQWIDLEAWRLRDVDIPFDACKAWRVNAADIII